MRPVIVTITDRVKTDGGWNYVKREVVGTHHTWGTEYEEFENGTGNYSVGIVELEDGTVITAIPTTIRFILDNDEV